MSRAHEQLDELLAGYVDGTLSAGELAAVEGYLDGHPELREQLQAMRMDSQTLAALPTMRAPSGLVEPFNQKLEREALLDGPMQMKARRWMVRPTYVAAAAVLLVGVGVGVFMLDALKLRSGPTDALSGGSSVIAFEASERAKTVEEMSVGSREGAGEAALNAAGEAVVDAGAGAATGGIGGASTVASRAAVPAYPLPTTAAAPAGVAGGVHGVTGIESPAAPVVHDGVGAPVVARAPESAGEAIVGPIPERASGRAGVTGDASTHEATRAMPTATATVAPDEAARALIDLESAALSDEALVRFVRTVAGERPVVAVDVQAPVLEAAQMSFDGFLVDNQLLAEVSVDLPEVTIEATDPEAIRMQANRAAAVEPVESSRWNLQRRAVLVRDVEIDQVASLTRHLNAAPGEPLAEAFVVEDEASVESALDTEPVRPGDRLWVLAPKQAGEGIESAEFVVDESGAIMVGEFSVSVGGLKVAEVEEALSRAFNAKPSQIDNGPAHRMDAEMDRDRADPAAKSVPEAAAIEGNGRLMGLRYQVVRLRDVGEARMEQVGGGPSNVDGAAVRDQAGNQRQRQTRSSLRSLNVDQRRQSSQQQTIHQQTSQQTSQQILEQQVAPQQQQGQVAQRLQIVAGQRVDVVVVIEGLPPAGTREAGGAGGASGASDADKAAPTSPAAPATDESTKDGSPSAGPDASSTKDDAKKSSDPSPASEPSPPSGSSSPSGSSKPSDAGDPSKPKPTDGAVGADGAAGAVGAPAVP